MRLLIASDVHTEFHADHGFEFFRELGKRPDSYDVAVLAGDLSTAAGIELTLSLAGNYLKQTVLVAGNHEHYGSSFAAVEDALQRFAPPNVHALTLTNPVAVIDGQRFVGCTLWFEHDQQPCIEEDDMRDFELIQDMRLLVGTEHERAKRMLQRELRAGDVLVTHHLPSPRAVAHRWRGSALNKFFVGDIHDLIVERRPKLAIFGHTHDSIATKVGATRLYCNPFGYCPDALNPRFFRLVVESDEE
jgi:predicted phosphohydrolase